MFTFQENVGFITFYTGQNTKSRVHMVLVRCNKASSRKRNLKQQLIQPIDGGVSLIMIWLYNYEGKHENILHLKILETPLTVKTGHFV